MRDAPPQGMRQRSPIVIYACGKQDRRYFPPYPHEWKAKSLAVRFVLVTLFSVTLSPAPSLITTLAPTCEACSMTLAKLLSAWLLVWNSRMSCPVPLPPAQLVTAPPP